MSMATPLKQRFGRSTRARWWRIDDAVLSLLRRLMFVWVRVKVLPEELSVDPRRPRCYALEFRGLADLLIVEEVCRRRGLPRPLAALEAGETRSFLYVKRRQGWLVSRQVSRPSRRLERLVQASTGRGGAAPLIVPVSVFWGRSPERERSLLKLVLSEDWSIAGPVRKLLRILAHGRQTLVQFAEPLALAELTEQSADTALAARKLARLLRVHFRRQRVATIGPDLSHRRTLLDQVLQTRTLRLAIAREAGDRSISRRKATALARRFAEEIAADYSYAVIRLMDRLLSRLWNRLYDGISVGYIERLQQVAEANEIVYVPCHRSHIDYLLLSYVVYHRGFAVPHVAAGINLKLPIIGSVLRRGGAFFLRRSFKGNRLYTAVFSKYLGTMLARGYSIEYFIEGGRSRTGRLLQPKSGMLAMTVRTFLDEPKRPIVFVPVYFGYERLVEGRTYINELSGKPKEQESILGMLRALPVLRSRFGKVFVNFGRPIPLADVLAAHCPDWRGRELADSRPQWISEAVDDLTRRIMTGINEVAAVGPVNLLALALLATPRQAMLERDLIRQLELCAALARDCTPGLAITVTELHGAQMITYGESLGLLERRAHPLGDVIRLRGSEAVLATYFRNNVLHVFALPSLLACCFLHNRSMRVDKLIELTERIYAYIAAELFLLWPESRIARAVREVLAAMAQQRLLSSSEDGEEVSRPPTTSLEAVQLSVLAQATVQTIERYYLAIALLLKHGPGELKAADLEQQCHLMAQRMSLLYEFDSPEFFDRTLFRGFIDLLIARGFLRLDDRGRLLFDESVRAVAVDAELVLSEQIRHSILQVVHD